MNHLDFSQAISISKRVIRQAPALYQGMLCVRIKRGCTSRHEGQPRPKSILKHLNSEVLSRGGSLLTPAKVRVPPISLPSPPWNI